MASDTLWLHIVLVHELQELGGNLGEDLFGQVFRCPAGLPERHELDNVPLGLLGTAAKDPIVTVQHHHVLEIMGADSNNDDREREGGRGNNGVDGIGQVGDRPVSENQKDKILHVSGRRGLRH